MSFNASLGLGKIINSQDLIDTIRKNQFHYGSFKDYCISGNEILNAIEEIEEMPEKAEYHYARKNISFKNDDGLECCMWYEDKTHVRCFDCGYVSAIENMVNFCPQCGKRIKPVLMDYDTKKRLTEKYKFRIKSPIMAK